MQTAAFERKRHDLRLGMLELIFFAALPQLWLAWQYWRLGKAMSEERVRFRRITTAHPFADWRAIAVMQDKEDECAV